MDNILRDIVSEGDRDIIVTLPFDKAWYEYLAIFLETQHQLAYFEIVINSLPKTGEGKKCFITHGGYLKGWFEISRLKENEEQQIIIEVIPFLNSFLDKIPMPDIDAEYKYFLDNFNKQ